MKKILSLLFAFALLLTLFVPAVAAETDEWAETSDWSGSGGETAAQQTSDADDYSPEHGSLLFDYASLLTESEREEVLQVLSSEGKKVGCDFAVLTESYIDEDTIRSYAQEWYDSQGYGDDGALLVISMEDRNAQIVATGACEKVMNEEAGIDYLFDLFTSEMSDGNWASAFREFARGARQMMQEAAEGRVWKKPYNKIWILVAIGGGLLVAFIVTGNMKAKLKTVHFQTAAANYVVPGSMNLTNSSDVFLYASVTRTAKPKDDGGSSSRSSSGRSFSGGSRHF